MLNVVKCHIFYKKLECCFCKLLILTDKYRYLSLVHLDLNEAYMFKSSSKLIYQVTEQSIYKKGERDNAEFNLKG